ncbi:SDR family NAD(P)-dependent oxidoreductase [Micromonospora chalcea]
MTTPAPEARGDVTGRLRDRVAVVTGAGSLGAGWGNGKAASVLFARAGARVLAVDRRADAAEQTAAIVRAEGGECEPFTADVSRPDGVAALVEACLRRYGRIDVLLNNVGVGVVAGVEDTEPRHWDLVHRVNLTSAYLTTRAVVPHMREQGGGAIVNVSSVASLGATGDRLTAYGVSKAGLNHLTRAVAAEHAATGVRCNAVVVGLVDTPTVYAGQPDADPAVLRARRARRCPTGAMGDAWDVAHAALFLASEEARYVTGALLVVDGGLSLRFGAAV